MRITLLTTCVLLSAAGASAQVLSSSNLIGGTVTAGSNSSGPLVPGTDLWPGWSQSASGWVGAASAVVANQLTTTAIDLQWQLAAQAWSTGSSVAELDVQYEFSSPVLQRGHLVVGWQPVVAGTGQASLSIDLYGDGYIDAQGAAVIPVAFQQLPFVIRVHAETSAQAGTAYGPWGTSWSWTGDATGALRIRFVPSHATSSVVSTQSCQPAPLLLALPDLHEGVELQADLAASDDIALFALGFEALDVVLPLSPQCHLFIDPALVISATISPPGTISLPIAVPPTIRPASFLAQFVALNTATMALTASDALQIATP